jgi:hypothetical protein
MGEPFGHFMAAGVIRGWQVFFRGAIVVVVVLSGVCFGGFVIYLGLWRR